MKIKSLLFLAVYLAALGFVPQLRAAVFVTVDFEATIVESPFTLEGFGVGDGQNKIRGEYWYEQTAPPIDTGNNFSVYRGGVMTLVFLPDERPSQFSAAPVELRIDHSVAGAAGNPADVYSVTGFNLGITTLEGFRPAVANLTMVDTDSAVYANLTPPYPVDILDPAQFESKTLTVSFLSGVGAPFERRDIVARVDSIGVSAVSTVPESGSTLWLLGASMGVLALAKRRGATALR